MTTTDQSSAPSSMLHRVTLLLGCLVVLVAVGVGVAQWAGSADAQQPVEVAMVVSSSSSVSAAAQSQSSSLVGTAAIRAAWRQERAAKRLTEERKLELRAQFASAASSSRSAALQGLRGVGPYLTQASVKDTAFMTGLADRIASMTGAAMVIDVKGPYVYFDTTSPLAEKLGRISITYELPAVLDLLHSKGIYVIGRFIAVKDPGLANADPNTQIRHPRTGVSVGAEWVDPGLDAVIDYNMEILSDLVHSGIDEVNFDYIRFPTEYALSDVGHTGLEKSERLYRFLSAAREVTDKAGGHTKLGISTYAILGWDFEINMEMLGQNFVKFAPLLDVISPMAYPASFGEAFYRPGIDPRSRMYALVYKTMTGYRELLGDNAWKLRPWIQGYSADAKDMRDQIDAVYDSGACGFTVWNARNDYTPLFGAFNSWNAPSNCVPLGFPQPGA